MRRPPPSRSADSVRIPVDRYRELLEKERSADAALNAIQVIQRVSASWQRVYANLPDRKFVSGYVEAIKDYYETVVRFAAANPPVAADAATDDLPF